MNRTGFSAVSSQAEIDRIKAASESSIVMQPGQQSDLMYRYEFETLITGTKGSGKSIASIVWLIRGNLDVPDEQKSQTDIFYTNNPLFRAAVIRRNVDDLNEWVENAKRVYGTNGDLLGAKYTQQPREFTWPSGAKVICLHMGDSDAYMRITGQSITRLFWDEITFEPSRDNYEKVFSSIRSTHMKLRAQILLACNPEGPGLGWVKERFIKQTDGKGNLYKSGEVMRVGVKHPLTKQMVYTTRVFLHWTLSENKILLENDPGYPVRMATMGNPALVAAYLYGDWDAAGGKFFEFRRRPKPGEPANACHIYDATKQVIQPWWPRIVGLDWGYSHYFAAYKIAMSPDGRIWVIDEIAHKGIGSKELGALIARWCVPDFAGMKGCGLPPVIPVFMSPDAIDQRRDDYGTIAEIMKEGIDSILGRGSCEILDGEESSLAFDRMKDLQREAKMPLRRATNKRVFGWDTIRDLMKWDAVAAPDAAKYDHAYALELAAKDVQLFWNYQDAFVVPQEALPKLQISSAIKHLPDAFESAVSASNDLHDIARAKQGAKEIVQLSDDCLDAIRYGLVATRLYQQISTPVKNRVESVLAGYSDMTEEQRFRATAELTKRMSSETVAGFRIGRGANAGVYTN